MPDQVLIPSSDLQMGEGRRRTPRRSPLAALLIPATVVFVIAVTGAEPDEPAAGQVAPPTVERAQSTPAPPDSGVEAAATPDAVGPTWQLYQTEMLGGYQLIHLGSAELAVRDDELFVRRWDGERWRPAMVDDPPISLADAVVIESDSGMGLAVPASPGVWTSEDGESWRRAPGSDDWGSSDLLVSDGRLLVAIRRGRDGFASFVVNPDGSTASGTSSGAADVVTHVRGSGFVVTGFRGGVPTMTTSPDGVEWRGPEFLATPLFAVDGGVFDVYGRRLDPESGAFGPHPIPGGHARVWPLADLLIAQDAHESGFLVMNGDRWMEVDLGRSSGLPSFPERLEIRSGVVHAWTTTDDGVSSVHRLVEEASPEG